ncbi:MAG: hypothetical protein AB7F43_13605 [Bacteriovoracia bacterium]
MQKIKVFGVILGLFLVSKNSWARPLDSVSRALVRSALSTGARMVLIQRCALYGGISINSLYCNLAANAMVGLLDLDITQAGPPAGAAFSTTLITLLKNPSVVEFLEEIKEDLSSAKEVNLWNRALESSGDDFGVALSYLAVLFQDPAAKTHVAYAQDNSIDSKTIKLLNDVNQLAVERKIGVNWYPEDFQALNFRPYHFYVPAYLSYLLAKKLAYSEVVSFFIPFIMNTTYEFMSEYYSENVMSSILRVLKKLPPETPIKESVAQVQEALSSLLTMRNNPDPFEIDDHEESLKDIFDGYSGAIFGVLEKKPRLEFNDFKKQISKNPAKFIENLFSVESCQELVE